MMLELSSYLKAVLTQYLLVHFHINVGWLYSVLRPTGHHATIRQEIVFASRSKLFL